MVDCVMGMITIITLNENLRYMVTPDHGKEVESEC
jgi:hypothetical protein